MAQCEHEYPGGQHCGAAALTPIEAPAASKLLCWNHSDDPDIEAKRFVSRAKGGRTSRKIEPWRIPAEIGTVETTADLKRLLNSVLRWLVEGRISPTQARAVVSIGGGLRDAMELELYEQLSQRLDRLESGDPPKQITTGGATWLLVED